LGEPGQSPFCISTPTEPTDVSVRMDNMAWKPLAKAVELPEQTLVPFARTGFTAVEWGGAEVN